MPKETEDLFFVESEGNSVNSSEIIEGFLEPLDLESLLEPIEIQELFVVESGGIILNL